MSEIQCAQCGASLVDDAPGQPRTPCADCGATKRTITETIVDRLGVHTGYRVKLKRPSLPSDKKLRADGYSGVEVNRATGKRVRVTRDIDKDQDRYVERVVDLESGQVLHECDEPLSTHRGHGSARRKPPGPTDSV